jgi:hypothetical protein
MRLSHLLDLNTLLQCPYDSESWRRVKARQPITYETLLAIWGAPDVMAAIRRVQAGGTPDEKWYAGEVLRECNAFTLAPPDELKDDGREKSTKQDQRIAWDALAKRCAGTKIPRAEWRSLLKELLDGAATSTSPLGVLRKIADREREASDNRWTTGELDVISKALQGNDPLQKRQAFNVLYSAIDRNAPGGDARGQALTAAVEAIVNPTLSDFEMLERCAIFSHCEAFPEPLDKPTVILETPEDREFQRLLAAYSNAFAKQLPATSILAIR